MNLGETFVNLNPSSPPHLWVVCSTPDAAGEVVIFNLTTPSLFSDTTCVLRPGDHEWIDHDSVVEYERGRMFSEDLKSLMIRRGVYRECAPMRPAVLRRIQEGALASPFTPERLAARARASLTPLP